MKSFSVFVAVFLLTSAAWADSANKQRELAAASLTEKPAKSVGPAFSMLKNPKAAPARTDVTANTPVDRTAPGTQTIQYDDGMITSLPTIFGQIYGNVFNKGNSGKTITGALTFNSFSFYFMEDSLADTGLSINVAEPLNATSVMTRTEPNVTGLANSGLSFTTPTLNVRMQSTAFATSGVFSSTMYLGGWCLNANTTFPIDNETLGLSNNMITEGGGFQGYTSDDGTGANTFAEQSFNAIIRANVTGNVVPVELMAYEVE